MDLSARQRANLDLILDTFAPGDGNGIPSASDVQAGSLLVELAGRNPRKSERDQLAALLKVWDSPGLGLALTGRPRRFSSLGQAERERVLLSLAGSKVAAKRALFGALRSGAVQTYYLNGGPALWDSLGYDGSLGPLPNAQPAELQPLRATADTTLDCDVVVVGSGAGGGAAAAVLAQAGLDVVVLEAGEYHSDGDFDGNEKSGFTRLYASAPQTSAEGAIALVAGAGLGGSTVVNYTTSFRTPDHVRDEWAAQGAQQFAAEEYDEALDAVCARISVNEEHNLPGPRDVALERGAKALGWSVGAMPRNVVGCVGGVECGRCGFGCRIGAKQSVAKTWLVDAAAAGARLYVGVSARRVTSAHGRATGVEATTTDGHTVTVRARAVVAAAGAIQTPALLHRSGLKNPNIGAHLRLHPVSLVQGLMDERIAPWEGALQARYVDEHRNMDGDGYGVLLETGPATPTLASVFTGWEGGRAHLERMQQLQYLVGTAILVRDKDSIGTVKTAKDGEPVVRYKLSPHDARHMLRGQELSAELIVAAGAKRVFTSHQKPVDVDASDVRSGEFGRAIQAAGTAPGRLLLASLHLMGSARMGGSVARSAVDPDGQTWDLPGLYVADGSCFPTASGVNPMISVEAIAVMNARRLAGRLA